MNAFSSEKSPSLRIVSLVPSVTELLCSLGLAPYLVGRTGFCIHPLEALRSVAKVGGTKDVNLAKIAQLRPSHVIVNVDENTLPTVQALEHMGLRLVVTHPQSPLDNIHLIDQFATNFIAAHAVSASAAALKAQIFQALEGFAASSAQPPAAQRVLYLIWRDPWMTVAQDTYISRMLGLIHWQTWPAVQGGARGAARYPVVDMAQAAQAGIERVLLSSEPFHFDASHLAELQALLPQAKVQLVDGEALSWYGSRCLKGFALLQQLAQGDAPSPQAHSPE